MLKTIHSDPEVMKVLSKLAGSKASGQKVDPPWFHPFPARLPLCVAEHFVEHITKPDAIVLDPMVGSGTTIVAARKHGRVGLGFDRDPLALLIARTATQTLDTERLEQMRKRILDRALTVNPKMWFSNALPKLPQEDLEFINYWFPRQSQKQLFALAASIHEEPEGIERDLAWVVYSILIIAKSKGASYALDISRSRPHKRLDKPIVLPFDGWDQRFKFTARHLPFADSKISVESNIRAGDARSLPLENGMVDLVLTSPPYISAVDYLRSHKFSLIWMGYSLQILRELRGTMVGTERGLFQLNGLPPDLEERLKKIHQKSHRSAQLRRYLCDLHKILGEIERVLCPGGLAILILGPSIITSSKTDAAEVVSKIANVVGLREVGSVVRHLKEGRRSLPPPSKAKGNPLSKRMRREVIVAFRK